MRNRRREVASVLCAGFVGLAVMVGAAPVAGQTGLPPLPSPATVPLTPPEVTPAGMAAAPLFAPPPGPPGSPLPAPAAPAGPAAMPPAAAGTGDSLQRVLIADVRIVGNETTSEHIIQGQIKTRKAREFDPEVVQADVRRLASTGRFFDVRSYTQTTPAGVVVTFEVFERPTIRYVRYLGNRGVSDKALAKQDGLEVGEPLNRYAVEEARRKLEEFYISKGYAKAQVLVQEGDQPHDKGAVFAINEGALERIFSVQFVGNTIASEARLKTQIKSKPGFLYLIGGKVEAQKIEEDLERLTAYYRGLGFFNARIGRELQFDDSGKWLTITFVIDEGQRYVVRNVAVVGNQKFSQAELLGQLELQSGDYFNLAKMNRDVRILTDTYGGEGHIFADIKADPRFLEEPGQLDLVYDIQEGGVWHAGKVNVHIAGEYPHTRQSVVLNRLSVRPGEIIDIRELRASERRLKSSQLFENDPSKGEAPRVVVRPPELQESLGTVAEGGTGHGTAYRGQSP